MTGAHTLIVELWVSVALLFNYGFYAYFSANFGAAAGTRLGLEFLTGYVVEQSLAVDNIFVFVLVFAYFGIPQKYQHRVLFYGIIGARFYLLKYALAFILIFVGLKMVWLNDLFGGKFPISWSLGIIGALLAVGIGASLLRKRPVARTEPV